MSGLFVYRSPHKNLFLRFALHKLKTDRNVSSVARRWIILVYRLYLCGILLLLSLLALFKPLDDWTMQSGISFN